MGDQMPWSKSPPMVAGLLGWGAWPHRFPLSSPTGRARHGLRCGPSAGTLRPGLRGPSAEPGIPTWLRGGRPGGGRGEGLQEAQACVTQPPCPVTLGTLPHFALINSKQLEDYTLRCFVFSCHGDGNSSFLCLRRQLRVRGAQGGVSGQHWVCFMFDSPPASADHAPLWGPCTTPRLQNACTALMLLSTWPSRPPPVPGPHGGCRWPHLQPQAPYMAPTLQGTQAPLQLGQSLPPTDHPFERMGRLGSGFMEQKECLLGPL